MAVGLGNPGSGYEATRHNLGAIAVELLARRHGERLRAERGLQATMASCRVEGKLLALARPQTYMNDSGLAVRALVRRFGIEEQPGRLVVVHDELDLPVGVVKVKVGGGVAGHNGLRSIQSHLHTADFLRVRIGIGKPPGGKGRGVDHVLRRPGRAEQTELEVSVEIAADAVELILSAGPAEAMNAINVRR